MSENNTANQEVEQVEPIEQPVETSKEEKFFGVKHQIGKSKDDSTENKNEEVEVEVIDDRPPEDRKPPKAETAKNDVEEEIEGINDKVQKRIDKLKYEYHEERRAKEASDRLREEAVNYAQKIQGENKRLSALINKGEEALLGQISAKSSAELEKAKAEFKEAYEAGNSDAMLAANEKILAAQVDLKSATEKLNYYQQQQEAIQQQAQQPVQQPQQPPQQALDSRQVKWLQDNKWFSNPDYPEATGYAYGIHERLIKVEGVNPNSDQYYEEIDKRMSQRFPELYEGKPSAVATETEVIQEEVETETSKKPSNVVAPATRNNGAMPRKVQLTATQVALARRLGLTPEQYAKQLAQENR